MTFLLSRILSIITILGCATSLAVVQPLQKAPPFSVLTHEGHKVKLKQFKGKIVVLEWFNQHCPFVRKFYESNSMQQWQDAFVTKGVVWLTVNSAAINKSGYENLEQTRNTRRKFNIRSSFNLIDSSGELGRKYGAKTTPHIFILDKEHLIAYQGAVDNSQSSDIKTIKNSENYLLNTLFALTQIGRSRNIKTNIIRFTNPYGLQIRY